MCVSIRLSGRRRELLLSAVIYFLASLVTFVAPSLILLLASRVAYGMAIGLVRACSLRTLHKYFADLVLTLCWFFCFHAIQCQDRCIACGMAGLIDQ